MNRLYILAFAALVLNAAEIKAQWQTFSHANTVVTDVNSLTFVNGTVGFAGGTSSYSAHACVSKTEDGGRTWRNVWPDSGYWAGGYLIAGMALVGDTTLWAVYDDNVVVIDARADTVLRTMIEFGIDVARCYDRIITDIEIIDDSIIVMSVCNGVLLSTNAGSQWRYVEVTLGRPERISFSDRWNGLLLDWFGGIYRTSDGGNTWLLWRSNNGICSDVYDILSISAERGIAVGSGIAITLDSGKTWNRAEHPSNMYACSSVVAVDDTLLWCAGSDNILHSTDAGATWYYQVKTFDVQLNVIYAVDSDTVHAAGQQDHYFTSNSGRTPSSVHESTSPLVEMWRCTVFPNPVTEGFTISSEKYIDRYRIVDALGSVVQDVRTDVRSGDRMRVEVDCGVLANRAYVVVVSAGGTERTIPIVVCR